MVHVTQYWLIVTIKQPFKWSIVSAFNLGLMVIFYLVILFECLLYRCRQCTNHLLFRSSHSKILTRLCRTKYSTNEARTCTQNNNLPKLPCLHPSHSLPLTRYPWIHCWAGALWSLPRGSFSNITHFVEAIEFSLALVLNINPARPIDIPNVVLRILFLSS